MIACWKTWPSVKPPFWGRCVVEKLSEGTRMAASAVLALGACRQKWHSPWRFPWSSALSRAGEYSQCVFADILSTYHGNLHLASKYPFGYWNASIKTIAIISLEWIFCTSGPLLVVFFYSSENCLWRIFRVFPPSKNVTISYIFLGVTLYAVWTFT